MVSPTRRHSLWSWALLWCLWLAVPLQGYAALSKALCHCPPQASQGVHEAHSGHPHTGHEAESQGAELHAAHHTAAPHTSALTPDDCSQCHDCCTGLAPMPTLRLAPGQALPRHATPPAPPQAGAHFLTSGLERPPRTAA